MIENYREKLSFFFLPLFPNAFSFLLILVDFSLYLFAFLLFPYMPLYSSFTLFFFLNMWKVLCSAKAQYRCTNESVLN